MKMNIKFLNNKHTWSDMFIDCTFKSLLSKTLKEPFNDYSTLLPNNKVLTGQEFHIKIKNKS